MMMAKTHNAEQLKVWRRLRFAVGLEGLTLVTLVLIASPLKRLADLPIATQIMGPLHGLAFMFLLYVLVDAYAAQIIDRRSVIRLFIGSMIPFGGLCNQRWLVLKAGT